MLPSTPPKQKPGTCQVPGVTRGLSPSTPLTETSLLKGAWESSVSVYTQLKILAEKGSVQRPRGTHSHCPQRLVQPQDLPDAGGGDDNQKVSARSGPTQHFGSCPPPLCTQRRRETPQQDRADLHPGTCGGGEHQGQDSLGEGWAGSSLQAPGQPAAALWVRFGHALGKASAPVGGSQQLGWFGSAELRSGPSPECARGTWLRDT